MAEAKKKAAEKKVEIVPMRGKDDNGNCVENSCDHCPVRKRCVLSVIVEIEMTKRNGSDFTLKAVVEANRVTSVKWAMYKEMKLRSVTGRLCTYADYYGFDSFKDFVSRSSIGLVSPCLVPLNNDDVFVDCRKKAE